MKGFVLCTEWGQTFITLISRPANATSWHCDMFTGAGLSLSFAEQEAQPSLPLLCQISNSVTNCQISGNSILALYLKIELIRVGGGRAHSEIWLFVICQTVPLSFKWILQNNNIIILYIILFPHGQQGLEKTWLWVLLKLCSSGMVNCVIKWYN